MARHRMKIDEWELYVPNVDEGAERHLFQEKPDQAITMELRFLSKRERDYFQRIAQRAEKGPEERKKLFNEFRRMLDENVRNIKNLTVEGGIPVTTGVDLFESDEEDIKSDVAEALMSIGSLEAGLVKKLSSPSASSFSRQTSNAGGDAQDATQQSNQDNQEIQTQKIQSCG